MVLRWTKLQDFCLRLGLLKVLVASLPTSRTSRSRSKILQKLKDLLFRHVEDADLLAEVRSVLGEQEESAVRSVANALLVTSGAGSWGQPLKESTVYKLLEWGHTTGLVAKGNRISERGLILRSLLDTDASQAFVEGDVTAWNPFRVTGPERAFFFYHLGENDEVLWRIVYALGRLGAGREVGVSDDSAYEITLWAMKRMLSTVEGSVSIPDLPRLRTVRQLTNKIDRELNPNAASAHMGAYGPPAPRRPGRSGSKRGSGKSSKKNADHQTIPRFEQLVDIGFLDKSVGADLQGAKLLRARRAWSFVVTQASERFAEAAGGAGAVAEPDWRWNGFGAAVGASGIAGRAASSRLGLDSVMRQFLECYGMIRRRAGHTPFESVALLTLLHVLDSGAWIEISDLHGVFLELKRRGSLEDHIYFAAGNEIDRMFIKLRPDFGEAWAASDLADVLPWGDSD